MVTIQTGRAKPLGAQDRRDSILDAAMPLVMKHGADVTTRQIADAAGIAEGTVFRVFDDKQAIIDAVVLRFMDPKPTIAALSAIDTEAPLEHKLLRMVEILRARFQGVTGILTALGIRELPVEMRDAKDLAEIRRGAALAILEPHRDELRVEPETAVHVLRLICFASALPPFGGTRETSSQEIVDVVLHGIAVQSSETKEF